MDLLNASMGREKSQDVLAGLSEPDLLRLVAFIPRLNKPAMVAMLTAQQAEYVTE